MTTATSTKAIHGYFEGSTGTHLVVEVFKKVVVSREGCTSCSCPMQLWDQPIPDRQPMGVVVIPNLRFHPCDSIGTISDDIDCVHVVAVVDRKIHRIEMQTEQTSVV